MLDVGPYKIGNRMNIPFDILYKCLNKWVILPILIPLAGLIILQLSRLEYWFPFELTLRLKALPEPLTILRLLTTILAIYVSYLFLLLAYFKKPNIKNFEFINPPGCYKHKRNGKYYCKPCLLKDKIESEISWINHIGMQCNVCGTPYRVSMAHMSHYPELEKQFDKAIKEWNEA